jgi:hypothetical protein
MATRIPRNRLVHAYCRQCKEKQDALLWSFHSKDGARCSKCAGPLDRIGKGVPKKLRISTLDTIDYPQRESEFEVQAYIYHALRAKGFDVRGQVTSRQGTAVLDLVVFNDRKEAVCTIEVKKAVAPNFNLRRLKIIDATEEQLKHYRTLCPTVKLICGMRWAVKFCESFKLPIVEKS